MNKRSNYILCGLLIMATLTNAQNRKIKKASDNFTDYAFGDAIASYESLIEKGYTEEKAFKNLGNANYLNANYEEASDWYGKLFQLEGADIDPEYIYRYAQALKSLKKYGESDQWMQKFHAEKPNDTRAKKFGESPDYLKKIKERSGRYDIVNLPINSSESDFAPSFNGERLVFSTARDTGIVSRNTHRWNQKPFLNLYRSTPSEEGEFTSASKLPGSLNKKTHESSTTFTKDGNTLYFTRNNSKDGKFARDTEGLSRLKVYRATLRDGQWGDITELPFNGNSHSVAHPTLNPDESQLYFASDMLGTLGASDIFVVDINSDGSFGTPKNLGSTINTEGRETFPFVTSSNVLYFASDGHPGLGGLDVFATRVGNSKDLYILNVGSPLNSEQDDFSFIIDEETKKGFFASNRSGGKGSDDIYSFVERIPIDLDCKSLIQGMVKTLENGEPLANAKITILNGEEVIVAQTFSAKDGSFTMDGECRKGNYKAIAFKEAYDQATVIFSLLNPPNTSTVEILLNEINKGAPAGTDLVKYLDIEPIYFDFDKWNIREDAQISIQKIITYMNDFPKIKILIRSHTDARAGKAYNIKLSDKRANRTMEYLKSKGIHPDRISAQGFGETMITNTCTDRVWCSEDKHQYNRRSEFVVVE